MAPLPKKKHTKSRTGKRRGNKKLSMPMLTKCKHCGSKKYPHKACPNCGRV